MEHSLEKQKIISLDDIKATFISRVPREEYVVKENVSVLTSAVGDLDSTSPLENTLETIDNLESSIDSAFPKVPVISTESIKKIKLDIKKKMEKKTIKEELNEVTYDEMPELANLENTIILNAAILKQELRKSEVKEEKAKINRLGRNVVIAMYVLLALVSFVLPYIAKYIF